MKNLKCFGCGGFLSNNKGLITADSIFIDWVDSPDFKTRVFLCGACHADIESKKEDIVKNALNNCGVDSKVAGDCNVVSGIGLDEYIAIARGNKCCECNETINDNDLVRENWAIYHKKCRGIHEKIFK